MTARNLQPRNFFQILHNSIDQLTISNNHQQRDPHSESNCKNIDEENRFIVGEPIIKWSVQ